MWLAVPQLTEGQRIGNQIDAAMIFARAHFVNVHLTATHQLELPFVNRTSPESAVRVAIAAKGRQ